MELSATVRTRFHKYVFPTIFGLAMLASAVQFLTDRPILPFLPDHAIPWAVFLSAILAATLFRFGSTLKTITLEETGLVVSDGNNRIVLAPIDIRSIESKYMFMPREYVITIHLTRHTQFGKEVCFLPKGEGFVFSTRQYRVRERLQAFADQRSTSPQASAG